MSLPTPFSWRTRSIHAERSRESYRTLRAPIRRNGGPSRLARIFSSVDGGTLRTAAASGVRSRRRAARADRGTTLLMVETSVEPRFHGLGLDRGISPKI